MTESQHITPENYHRMKPRTYRMLENGETAWSGQARDAEHAEEKCYFYEEPSPDIACTLQYWNEKTQSWATVYKDAHISTD